MHTDSQTANIDRINPDQESQIAASVEDQRRLDRLRSLCRLMDRAVVVPGANVPVGLDSLVGLVPGIGDGLTAIVSGYVIHQAGKLGARKRTLVKMCGNVVLDALVGSVPLLGDLFDVGWKCNMRNLRLLESDLQGRKRGKPVRAVVRRPGNIQDELEHLESKTENNVANVAP